MPKQKNNIAPSPVNSGTPEPNTDAAEAMVSKDAAGAESHAAPTASDGLEDTAPVAPGTALPTSLQDDTSEARTTNDEAGAESQVPAAQSNTCENNLQPIAEPTSEFDFGECFAPSIAHATVAAAPTPQPKTKPETPAYIAAWQKVCGRLEGGATSTGTVQNLGLPAPAENGSTGDAEMTQPKVILAAPVEAPLPPPRVATAVELCGWIKESFLGQTPLPEDAAELVPFWVIATWFQDALTVLPCLVITGPAYDARVVMHLLRKFCRQPALLAGFQRSHLSVLHRSCKTNLVWEPNLDKRTADLLGNLTDRNFLVAEGGSLTCYSKSTAIYAGESPLSHTIANSIHLHICPTNAAPTAPPRGLRKMIERIPVHLNQYRTKNLDYVQTFTWVPRRGVCRDSGHCYATRTGHCGRTRAPAEAGCLAENPGPAASL